MPLSSSSLIHLTANSESLKGILKEGLKLGYCKESISLDDDTFPVCIPMVSFCDIPLSEIKDHLNKYGCFGIGLTKEWALRNGLNPVLYINKESHVAKSFMKTLENFIDTSPQKKPTKGEHALIDILRFMKNYQGDLTRKGKTTLNYRYSDEREWRFIPSVEAVPSGFLGLDDFEINKSSYLCEIESERLKFRLSDIRYIIVEKEDCISEFIQFIKSQFYSTEASSEVDRLVTRILTVEQIQNDI